MDAFGRIRVGGAMITVAAAATACGDGPERPSARASARSAIPLESCAWPDADRRLVSDRYLEGALTIGPLVIYPADDIDRIPRGRRGSVQAPKIVVITTTSAPTTLTVGRSVRKRFSLMFADATTGWPGNGFRVADGITAVRFQGCGGRRMGFRGGFLYRGAQCVPIIVRPAGARPLRATLAVGRAPSSCSRALHPRPGAGANPSRGRAAPGGLCARGRRAGE